MYKNYIFDLYGTLIDIRTDESGKEFWTNFAAWMTDHGMEYKVDELRTLYEEEIAKLMEIPSKYSYPEIDILPVFSTICKLRKSNVTSEEIWQVGEMFRILSTSYLQLYPNSLMVLQGLKAAGKRIFLLSNAQRVFTQRELVSTGILSYFDDVFISSDEGCKKPDTGFFQKLIEKHGLKIEECVMIGNDGSADIGGATQMGMDAFYVRTQISPENEPLPACKYVFEDGDIGHVLELIKSKEE